MRLSLALRVACTYVATAGLLILVSGADVGADNSFVTFESGQVRPLALSPDGSKLFAVNTPDNQLEIFTVSGGSLTHTGAVPVGLEPVSVAPRNNSEVWVVNHLSDSISVVDVASSPARVVRSLLVGDEPRDIVFAGPSGNRAFVTTAHRGQNSPVDPELATPGVGRADVWVFDATALGTSLGGTPLTVVTLFGDTPRALAATPDGTTVYAAVFHSGNQTTALSEGVVCDGGAGAPPCNVFGSIMPGGLPPPNTNFQGVVQPEVGLIVKYNPNTSAWEDPQGRNWNNAVRFFLPDTDVFAIDAGANPPQEIGNFSGVGTVLFNMVVNPQSGKVYVSNTEARNDVRFEGVGNFGGSTVRGDLHEARITILDGADVLPRHLNSHINYSVVPSPAGTAEDSLATPTDMAVTSDGATMYVAAFGSNKVGVFSTAALEGPAFSQSANDHILLTGGGPSGLALHESQNRLYVLTRFDNSLSVVDTALREEVDHLPLHNPEPLSVVHGRRFLYDASLTSSNGEASCAACHVFGDLDSLGWDLGDPDGTVLNNPNPFRVGPFGDPSFHPMKGPMTTQSLRGLANHGPMHWRGDRTGGNDLNFDPLDEDAAFKKFNAAFRGLLGRSTPLADDDMQAFTDFILQVTYPPNPIRALDNSLTPDQQTGRTIYLNALRDGGLFKCNDCHVLDPAAGFFGSDGFSSFEGETQHFKIAHLRNVYQKVGMFGMPAVPGITGGGSNAFLGDQIRGFGFLHDGSVDTVFRFLSATVFTFPDDTERRQVEQFVLAFDSNMAPIVGQQITLSDSNAATVGPRIDLLIARAAAGECDLTVKGTIANEQRGAYRTAAGTFQTDRAATAPIGDATLRGLAATPGQELTYTCVPPGSGVRIGVDRDSDRAFDGDEADAGTDPASALSLPPEYITCSGADPVQNPSLRVSKNPDPSGDERLTLKGEWQVNPTDPPIDPKANGVRFKVDGASGSNIFYRVIPGGAPTTKNGPGWKVNRRGTRWTFRDKDGTVAGGVTRVVITDKSAQTPGLFKIRVVGKNGNFQIDGAALPVSVLVTLGTQDQGDAGQCATRTFNADGGPRPSCRISGNGNIVRCR